MPETANKYSNAELAGIFTLIANLLEIKGEVIYKILAYRKAAESLMNLGRDANDVWRGQPDGYPRRGQGHRREDRRAAAHRQAGVPGEAQGRGARRAWLRCWRCLAWARRRSPCSGSKLGVTSLAELEAAARGGKLRGLPGMGEKSEAQIIAGIESLGRRATASPWGGLAAGSDLLEYLRGVPGVAAAEAAGSLRRMRSTVGDLDILAAAADFAVR